MLKSCLVVMGVLIMPELAAAEALTTQTAAAPVEASMPDYLVNWEMPAPLVELVKQGELAKADQWLDQRLQGDGQTSPALTQEKQRLQRLARDFDLTAERLLPKIQRQVPDATLSDIEKWREAGGLQWLPVDGQVRFFRREPSNLFLFEETAKSRKKKQAKGGDPAGGAESGLTRHMAEALAQAAKQETSLPLPMLFRAKHRITVKAGGVPKGETIRCWMPYPQQYRQQQEPRLVKASPAETQIAPSGSSMRTIYMEQVASNESSVFEVEYEYVNSAFVPNLSTSTTAGRHLPPEEKQKYLAANPPHIEFTPEIQQLANSLTAAKEDPVEKAFAIWSWIDQNIPWAAEIEYAVLPNIVRKVLSCKRGDCGTQALLFVSLCRAAEVPARWQSGWVTRPDSWNMHDWAEFHADGHGWLPADPSIGRRKGTESPEVRDFLFGHLDAYRMVANLDYGEQFTPAKQHLRSDPVDNQRGEVEWKGGNLYFDDWTYEVEVESAPVELSSTTPIGTR